MTNLTTLSEYKELRKKQKVLSELEKLDGILDIVLKGLISYKKFTPVKNIIGSIAENKQVLNIHKRQIKKSIENPDENSLEKIR